MQQLFLSLLCWEVGFIFLTGTKIILSQWSNARLATELFFSLTPKASKKNPEGYNQLANIAQNVVGLTAVTFLMALGLKKKKKGSGLIMVCDIAFTSYNKKNG